MGSSTHLHVRACRQAACVGEYKAADSSAPGALLACTRPARRTPAPAQAGAVLHHEQRPVCLDAPKCTVLLPCRHLALCAAPASRGMLGAPPLCPLCRCGVADTMQLFV